VAFSNRKHAVDVKNGITSADVYIVNVLHAPTSRAQLFSARTMINEQSLTSTPTDRLLAATPAAARTHASYLVTSSDAVQFISGEAPRCVMARHRRRPAHLCRLRLLFLLLIMMTMTAVPEFLFCSSHLPRFIFSTVISKTLNLLASTQTSTYMSQTAEIHRELAKTP